jgi:hypothetical protein
MNRPAGVTVGKAKEMWDYWSAGNLTKPVDNSQDIAFIDKYRSEITNMIATLCVDRK